MVKLSVKEGKVEKKIGKLIITGAEEQRRIATSKEK